MDAFLGLRLREKHSADVQLERTTPFNEFEAVEGGVRAAAEAYEDRDAPSTPYLKFVANAEHPSPEQVRRRELSDRAGATLEG